MADSTIKAYEDYIDKANEYVNSYNPNETVNYNDERLTNIKAEQAQKEAEINKNYDNMINDSNTFYQNQIDASKEWAEKQSQLQQENTDFAIEKINQEKQQAEKDYTKEQKASYVDYQKQTNKYGVNAEQMAASGLTNSGYSESSNVSMYNTYQNRVATARESFNRAVLNFNNSIKEAELANNSALAEIYYNALQQQLELSLEGFQYKNSLLEAKTNQINTNNSRYDTKYQNVLAQINQEIANRQNLYNQYTGAIQDYNNLVEDTKRFNQEMDLKRQQFDAEMAYQKERDRIADEQWKKEYALAQTKAYNSINNALEVADTPTDKSSNADVSKFMQEAPGVISSMIKIANNGQTTENKQRAKELLKQLASKIDSLYDRGLISAEEGNKLLNQMGGYF